MAAKGEKEKKNQEYGCELSAKEKQKKTGEEYCCAFSKKGKLPLADGFVFIGIVIAIIDAVAKLIRSNASAIRK